MKYVKNSLKFIVQNMTNLSTLNSCKICSTCPILDFFSPKFIKNVEFLQNTKKLYHQTIEMVDSIFSRTPCIDSFQQIKCKPSSNERYINITITLISFNSQQKYYIHGVVVTVVALHACDPGSNLHQEELFLPNDIL